MKNNGQLVISLDFELIWGVFDKVEHHEKLEYFENTRKLIPELLKLFNYHEIHSTWATVGMLFNESWEEWMENLPQHFPKYTNQKLSAYNYGNEHRSSINEKLCWASELIDLIAKSDNQEMATHTYSHYYCLEDGQNRDSFASDLQLVKKLASKKGLGLKSLVFPRNQFNESYKDICANHGIKTIRINPENWYWKNTQRDTLADKIFRTGDAYIGLNDKSYNLGSIKVNQIVQQKASRLLRPHENNFKDSLRINRIKNEMEFAAKNNKVYHLWWHPHNFGADPESNLKDLNTILEHFAKCQDKYGMQSFTMDELTDLRLNLQ
ncbi:polysaccharide deacetylase [Gramella sp. Hel_I_59]|uniref:polysaccharide deacetylase family protein n=1 Tax=Gramella sp. Hel_I_59 TaxID=1249978 RepID=UPI00114DC65D|nr:polysaccharide deacetylase family protein [Gramella sp. Hel_I_59]TQI70432.1 polysaccharide deacetylase [Gramella sp. Hel_I_59]